MKLFNNNNSLAHIILLDYLKTNHSGIFNHNDVKRWRQDKAAKMKNNNNVMSSQYWLLAYEGTRNKWFNFDNTQFKAVNSSQEFKALLDNEIFFYNNNYEYPKLDTKHNPYYISRDEVIEKFNELKDSICKLIGDDTTKSQDIAKVKFDDFERIISANDY